MEEKAQVPEFYRDKSVFVTGATGFIGKVLIWKLLQSCPLINNIYILLRPKRNKDISERRKELLDTPIFANFKQGNEKLLDKIVAIAGDVGEPNLGLSDMDKARLIDEVDVVFYSAAMLKMDASLKDAINVNTEGVLRMMDIAREMKHLITLVYISTAYSSCDVEFVKEQLYPTETNPRDIINAIHCLPHKLVDKITKDLISPLPNTYIYSKRLAEIIIDEYTIDIPVVIARPTIVVSSYKEPIPGWIDTMNGVAGLSVAGGTGVLRAALGNPNMKANLVPVDIVCNSLVTIPWVEAQRQNKACQMPVYNLAAFDEDTITWRKYESIIRRVNTEYPFEVCLWYPSDEGFQTNKLVVRIKAFLYHWVPAFTIDAILLILGRKRIMMRIQRKISKGTEVIAYFVSHEWRFQTDNLLHLKNLMNPTDADIFPLRMPASEYFDLVTNTILIIKKYILKESPDNLAKCRRRRRMLYILKVVVDTALYFIVINVILNLLIRYLFLS